jgi:hypothetical protein
LASWKTISDINFAGGRQAPADGKTTHWLFRKNGAKPEKYKYVNDTKGIGNAGASVTRRSWAKCTTSQQFYD